jgi:hypothetical protein
VGEKESDLQPNFEYEYQFAEYGNYDANLNTKVVWKNLFLKMVNFLLLKKELVRCYLGALYKTKQL